MSYVCITHRYARCTVLTAIFHVNLLLQCFDMVGHQEEHPACKNWVMRCWCGCLEWGAEYLHMVQLMPLHPKPRHLLAGFTFLYRLTQVVLEKRPLNGCRSSGFHVNLGQLVVFLIIWGDHWKLFVCPVTVPITSRWKSQNLIFSYPLISYSLSSSSLQHINNYCLGELGHQILQLTWCKSVSVESRMRLFLLIMCSARQLSRT